MTRSAAVVGLWLVFGFVTWNVVFDHEVARAATVVTREQILRYEHGLAVSSIDDAFTPRVRTAARRASAWTGAVIATAVAVAYLLDRRGTRPRP